MSEPDPQRMKETLELILRWSEELAEGQRMERDYRYGLVPK